MKKYLIILLSLPLILLCFNGNAQNRIEISDGIYITTYGNVSVIENDILQQSIEIKVEKKSDDLYEIFCNNIYVKSVTKQLLKKGIKAALNYASGGSMYWLTAILVDSAVDYAYDKICEYYE